VGDVAEQNTATKAFHENAVTQTVHLELRELLKEISQVGEVSSHRAVHHVAI
jgi:hypothetical protein